MAQVTELGAGEATEMQQEARGNGDEAGRAGAAKTRIRTRIAHVGSEYRRDGTSVTYELCIAGWAVGTPGVPFEFTDLDTCTIWEIVAPTLRVRPWNDIWEVRISPFLPSTALPHVALTVAPAASPTRTTKPRPRADEAGAQDWQGRGSVTRIGRRRGSGGAARDRYSQATPSLSRSRRGL